MVDIAVKVARVCLRQTLRGYLHRYVLKFWGSKGITVPLRFHREGPIPSLVSLAYGHVMAKAGGQEKI